MTTKVQKWGNSYAIRIPKQMAEDLNLTEGSSVDIKHTNKSATLKPVHTQKEKALSLAELMRGVKRSDVPELIDWGKPVGKEVW